MTNVVNTAPDAVNDTKTTNEDTATIISVLTNDTDAEDNTLNVSSVTQGANGTVIVNPDKTLTYTPNANFNGTDSFTYTISDGQGGQDTATVNITVTSINDAPVATNNSATLNEDASVTINVLGNDSDVEGNTLSVSAVTQPTHGSATINPDKTITYVPVVNYFGSDTFTYTVSDGQGGTATATVNITVNSVNDAPVASADNATTTQNTAVIISVLSNDTDVEGNTLNIASTMIH